MTEQQKIATLYSQLPPEKKVAFMFIMSTFANMIVLLANQNDKS